MKKKERLFILGILIAAAALWGAMTLLRPDDYGKIRITAAGSEYGVYSLNKDQVIKIGDTNVCEIKDGKVRMTDANCPDHLCIYQGAIDANGGMIVCLPNQIVIEGVNDSGSGSNAPEIDAVS